MSTLFFSPSRRAAQDDNNEREQFGYYCIPVPYSEFKAQCQDAENGDDEDEGDEDEDDEEEGPKGSARAAYEKQFKNDILLKPAAETPDHKWIATWATWKFIADYKHRADFVDPDNFAMVKRSATRPPLASLSCRAHHWR